MPWWFFPLRPLRKQLERCQEAVSWICWVNIFFPALNPLELVNLCEIFDFPSEFSNMAGESLTSAAPFPALSSPFHIICHRGFPSQVFFWTLDVISWWLPNQDIFPRIDPRYAMCIYSELLVPFMSPHTRTGFRAVSWSELWAMWAMGRRSSIFVRKKFPLLYLISIHIRLNTLVYFISILTIIDIHSYTYPDISHLYAIIVWESTIKIH